MQILVSYDVSTETAEGRKRLRKVAQICKDYGQRVQKSIFECVLDETKYEIMLDRLLRIINEKEDSLRVYKLREPRERYIKEYGIYKTVDFNETLIL